jgi:hypothetical protein
MEYLNEVILKPSMEEESGLMSFFGGASKFLNSAALPLGIVGQIGTSIFAAAKAKRQREKARKRAKKAKARLNEQMNVYKNLDTSNPYLNMENTMADLTINQKQAEFERQTFQQSQANIMDSLRGAAGGSGIGALAQSLAQQGQIAAQSTAASIGQQEAANQMAERQMAGNIQSMERQGEVYSRGLKKEQAETLLGMEQQRYAAAKGQEGMARQAQMDAITGGLTGAMDMFAGFNQQQSDFDYKSAYEKLAAAQSNNNDN